jgi:hypothetical protein
MTALLIVALILWALGVWWIIMDSTKQEKLEGRERDLIIESYRDHEKRGTKDEVDGAQSAKSIESG